MKVSPIAQGGTPQHSGVDVGRTADPIKLERARSIARGETPADPVTIDPQAERIQANTRKIKMRTQRSVYREDPGTQESTPEIADPAKQESATGLSTNPESTEAPAVEATQPLSPQFAALAKQKRALQLERAEFEKQKLETGQQGTADLVAKLKSNPLSVLQEHGISYDQLAEALLSGPAASDPKIQALEAKIADLEKGVKTEFQTRETQQEEAALTEMLYEAESLAKEGEAYELIRERDAYDQVLRLIHSQYKKTGRVLDVTEAMNQIETKLLSDAEKLANLSKVRAKFAPSPPTLQPQQRQGMRTLTARDTSAAPMSAKQRAMAAFNGTLRK